MGPRTATPCRGGPGHPDAEEGPGHEGGAQGQWSDHFERAAARPHETVHGAPEDVEKQPATEFRVLQDNADKFQHNKDLTERRVKAVDLTRQPTEHPLPPGSLLYVLYVLYLTRQPTEPPLSPGPCYMYYMCYISQDNPLNIHSPLGPCYMCYM